MHRVVPELIIENYRAGQYEGRFSAIGMFLDLSGFSTMTDVLMQRGQHGAEVLAGLMHGVFDPLVECIFNYSGKIVGFAGDGIMALYPIESDAQSIALSALTSAYEIQQRLLQNPGRQTIYGRFQFSVKIGLALGEVSWGILRSEDEKNATYYFRGTAVDESADAEHRASAGEILITKGIDDLLNDAIQSNPLGSLFRFDGFRSETPPPTPTIFPPIDVEAARIFMPEDVIVQDVRGEFRQIVNLFMRFPDLPDEKLHDFVRVIFELRQKYGGLLNRLDFGDKGCNMLMLWGAPVAYENDIGRALNFILDLQSRVDFPITAGVTYYVAHAGYLGSVMCEDYTCYGWGVNLASRFMMSAPVGHIWVDDRIARRVTTRFDVEYTGAQRFKGFAAEQRVNLLRGRRREALSVYQGEMVGRERELAALEKFITPLWEGKFAGLLLVMGDAGMGKGRLVHEFRYSELFEKNKALWALGQSDQILRQSFNPFRHWLQDYFGFSAQHRPDERKRIFDSKLDELIFSLPMPELVEELGRLRSVLGALVDLAWSDSVYEQLDAEGRYNSTLLALIALIKAESLKQPVILFIEDLQFIDEDTLNFLPRLKRALLSGGDSYPVAIIATSRYQGSRPIFDDDLADSRIDLERLATEAIARLTEILLGGVPSVGLVKLIMERSEGNPFFAEQIIHYLQEENLIEMSSLGWRQIERARDFFVPGDIGAILVARLDQLAHEVKEVVQTASVFGREFSVHVLAHMVKGADRLAQHVDDAERHAIWTREDEHRYLFTHGLLRDAAYSMQMQARRQELHRLAFEALEKIYADEPKFHYAELAHHAERGDMNQEAQHYYTLAGRTSVDAYQNRQAIEYFTRALIFTRSEDLGVRFDLLTERARLFDRIGDRTSQSSDLDSLEELTQQLGDARLAAKVEIMKAYYDYHAVGDYHAVVQRSQRVLDLDRKDVDANTVIDAYLLFASACWRLGNLAEAMQIGKTGLQLAREWGERLQEGRVLSVMGMVAIEQNDHHSAHDYLTEAVRIARETRSTDLEGRALNNLAMSAGFLQGDFALARDYFEQAYAIMHERGDRTAEGVGMGNLGYTAGMMGDFIAARAFHEQALSIAREVGNRYQEIYTLINLSAVTGVQNDASASMAYAREALELARAAGERSGEAWALLYLGHASLLTKEFEQARQAYNESIAIRIDLGQTNMAAEPMAGLAEAALALDDLPAAMRAVENILAHLANGGTLEGTEEPLRIYYACHQALVKNEDPRSNDLLAKAAELLDMQVSKLRDDESRRLFVEKVPWRRALQLTRRSQSDLLRS